MVSNEYETGYNLEASRQTSRFHPSYNVRETQLIAETRKRETFQSYRLDNAAIIKELEILNTPRGFLIRRDSETSGGKTLRNEKMVGTGTIISQKLQNRRAIFFLQKHSYSLQRRATFSPAKQKNTADELVYEAFSGAV